MILTCQYCETIKCIQLVADILLYVYNKVNLIAVKCEFVLSKFLGGYAPFISQKHCVIYMNDINCEIIQILGYAISPPPSISIKIHIIK